MEAPLAAHGTVAPVTALRCGLVLPNRSPAFFDTRLSLVLSDLGSASALVAAVGRPRDKDPTLEASVGARVAFDFPESVDGREPGFDKTVARIKDVEVNEDKFSVGGHPHLP